MNNLFGVTSQKDLLVIFCKRCLPFLKSNNPGRNFWLDFLEFWIYFQCFFPDFGQIQTFVSALAPPRPASPLVCPTWILHTWKNTFCKSANTTQLTSQAWTYVSDTQWRHWRGAGGGRPLWEAKCKNWAQSSGDTFRFSRLLGFSRIMNFCFCWGTFVFLVSITIHHNGIHYHFSTYFLTVG